MIVRIFVSPPLNFVTSGQCQIPANISSKITYLPPSVHSDCQHGVQVLHGLGSANRPSSPYPFPKDTVQTLQRTYVNSLNGKCHQELWAIFCDSAVKSGQYAGYPPIAQLGFVSTYQLRPLTFINFITKVTKTFSVDKTFSEFFSLLSIYSFPLIWIPWTLGILIMEIDAASINKAGYSVV